MYLQCVEIKDEELAMIWASKIDGKDIFPKLPVQIRIKREGLGRSLRAHRRAEAKSLEAFHLPTEKNQKLKLEKIIK